MTTYNANHILKLERLLDHMANAATSLSETREQVKMIQDIQNIMAEVRMCSLALAQPNANDGRFAKAAAVDRLVGIFEVNEQSMPTDEDYLADLGPCNK